VGVNGASLPERTSMDAVKEWLNEPFRAEMDTFHWFLFLGLLLVLMSFWRLILQHLGEGF
jgi:hypothetical protein